MWSTSSVSPRESPLPWKPPSQLVRKPAQTGAVSHRRTRCQPSSTARYRGTTAHPRAWADEGGASPVVADQVIVIRENHSSGPVAEIELGEDLVDVGFHGAFPDEELSPSDGALCGTAQ